MKTLGLVLILVLVTTDSLCYARLIDDNGFSTNKTVRRKRGSSWIFIDPDDTDVDVAVRWVKQYIDGFRRRGFTHEPIQDRVERYESTPPPVPEALYPNPCERMLPERPNFHFTGRRISETKCDEYIWDLKHRDDQRSKDEACTDFTTENGFEFLIEPSIIGGTLTEPGEFPHMGALGWRSIYDSWKFLCGCSLISHKFLLTAAHCSQASSGDTSLVDVNAEIVRLGVKNIYDLPTDVTISQVIVHPDYQAPLKYFDIALVEVTEDIIFNKKIQPACLWTHFDTNLLGRKAIATGWGYADLQNRQTPDELQAAEIDIIDSYECEELLRSSWNRLFYGLQPHQICAGVLSGGVDTCQGDSGGPLQVKIPLSITSEGSMSYIIGVTSFGVGCARANTPGVYTRVSSFLDWIEYVVWQKSE